MPEQVYRMWDRRRDLSANAKASHCGAALGDRCGVGVPDSPVPRWARRAAGQSVQKLRRKALFQPMRLHYVDPISVPPSPFAKV